MSALLTVVAALVIMAIVVVDIVAAAAGDYPEQPQRDVIETIAGGEEVVASVSRPLLPPFNFLEPRCCRDVDVGCNRCRPRAE